jgi:hypothetical protein
MDEMWRKMERAAEDKLLRRNLVRRAYKRSWSKPAYSARLDADAAQQRVPDDTRGMTARICGDPLPGRSALDREARRNG